MIRRAAVAVAVGAGRRRRRLVRRAAAREAVVRRVVIAPAARLGARAVGAGRSEVAAAASRRLYAMGLEDGTGHDLLWDRGYDRSMAMRHVREACITRYLDDIAQREKVR